MKKLFVRLNQCNKQKCCFPSNKEEMMTKDKMSVEYKNEPHQDASPSI